MQPEPPKWYDETETDPWLRSLSETRRLAARQGWCYQHVQALIVAIDQYAEAATGNRSYFLDRPQSIGGRRRNSDVP
jgi:hypothetical protein